MLEALKTSVLDLQLHYRTISEPLALTLSEGLASLPEELLAHIFEFTTTSNEGMRQPLWLSHVSRRFRAVAPGTHKIWTTLHSAASANGLEAFISRSGAGADVHIIIDNYQRSPGMEKFMELCFQTTSRWRSLKIDGDVEDTLRCMSEDYRLVLPRLEELHVKQDIIDNSTWWAVSDSDTLIPSWTPPNLLIVECEEYIPSPSSALTSVNSFAVSFSLTNDEYPALIGDLFRFLSLASSITNLSLAIHATTSVLQALGLTTTVCPSVTTLGLSLTSVPFPHGTDKLLGPIVNALHMPNMISYSVVIEFRRGDLEEANRGNRLAEDLGALVIAFLPDPLMHPHLTSLNITLLPSKVNDDIYFVVSSIGRESITIPLDRIPYVSSLTVKTFTRLLFTRRSAQGTTTANGATGLGTTSSPHALRELCLQECNNISMKSLERTVDSLMDAHAFLLLDRFEVNDCRYSNMMYDNIVDIIGEDILYYKCGNILITPPVSPRSSGSSTPSYYV